MAQNLVYVQPQKDYEALREGMQEALRAEGRADVTPVTAFRTVSMHHDSALQGVAGASGKRIVIFGLNLAQDSLLGWFTGPIPRAGIEQNAALVHKGQKRNHGAKLLPIVDDPPNAVLNPMTMNIR